MEIPTHMSDMKLNEKEKKELENQKTLHFYNKKKRAVLKLDVKKSSTMRIFVKVVTGNAIVLDLEPSHINETIKLKVKDFAGICRTL